MLLPCGGTGGSCQGLPAVVYCTQRNTGAERLDTEPARNGRPCPGMMALYTGGTNLWSHQTAAGKTRMIPNLRLKRRRKHIMNQFSARISCAHGGRGARIGGQSR